MRLSDYPKPLQVTVNARELIGQAAHPIGATDVKGYISGVCVYRDHEEIRLSHWLDSELKQVWLSASEVELDDERSFGLRPKE